MRKSRLWFLYYLKKLFSFFNQVVENRKNSFVISVFPFEKHYQFSADK